MINKSTIQVSFLSLTNSPKATLISFGFASDILEGWPGRNLDQSQSEVNHNQNITGKLSAVNGKLLKRIRRNSMINQQASEAFLNHISYFT